MVLPLPGSPKISSRRLASSNTSKIGLLLSNSVTASVSRFCNCFCGASNQLGVTAVGNFDPIALGIRFLNGQGHFLTGEDAEDSELVLADAAKAGGLPKSSGESILVMGI